MVQLIPRYIAGVILCVVLGAGLLFVALTRTEVGRDALRVQLERSFNASFYGSLSIDKMSGNLVHDLYARNVVFRDSEGQTVMRIDSVSMRPRWLDLFRETVSIRSATLFNPQADLVRDVDGMWNIEKVFRSTRQRTTSSPLQLSGANLTIHNGAVHTRNEGSEPLIVGNGIVFDFANGRFERINGRAAVDWRNDFQLIDLLHLSGSLPDLDLDVHAIRGQFVNADNGSSLSHLTLRVGESSLNLNASIDGFNVLLQPPDAESMANSYIRLSVEDSYLNTSELVRLFPALPVGGRFSVDARAEGTVTELAVQQFHVTGERTDFMVSGTVSGLPDNVTIRYDIAPSRLHVGEIAELLPFADFQALRQEQTISVTSSGDLGVNGRSSASIRSALRLEGTFGSLEGSVQARYMKASPVEYTLDLTSENLNPGAIISAAPWQTSVSGRLSVKGRGIEKEELQAQLDGHFYETHLAGRHLDTLQISGSLQGYRFQGASLLAGGGGALWSSGYIDLNDEPQVDIQSRAENFDVSQLMPDLAIATGLNGVLSLAGAGSGLENIEGTASLRFAGSTITDIHGTRSVPAFESDLTLSTRDKERSELRITGDFVEGAVQGAFTLGLLAETFELWTHGFRRSIFQTLDKPLDRPIRSTDEPSKPDHPFSILSDSDDFERMHLLRSRVAESLAASGLSRVRFEANLAVKRADVLAAVAPGLQRAEITGTNRLRFEANEAKMTLSASSTSEGVQIGSVGIVQPRITLNTAASMEPDREAVVSVNAGAHADHVAGGGQDFREVSAELHFQEALGAFRLSAGRIGESGYLELNTRINHFRDRNQLTLERFVLGIRDRAWQAVDRPRIDVYRNALVFHHVLLENRPPNTDGRILQQQIAIDGAVSSSRQDSVFVTAEHIILDNISELLALKDPIGGTLNGQVAVTSIDPHVEVIGELDIDDATFIGHPLGRARIAGHFSPQDNLIMFDLSLRQSDTVAVWRQNDMHISGAVHLNNSGPENELGSPDLFDLSLQVNSMDLFFFERIFPTLVDNVEARVSGTGRVRGDFRHPLFYADLQIPTGRFHVPEFNLAYEISGPVSIDRRGFHLSDVRLTDPSGGRASVSGGILFNEYRFFSFDLSGQLDDMLIMNVPSSRELPFYGRIWLSGNMTLRGPISSTFLRSTDLVANRRSELFIPVTGGTLERDEGFIVFADSAGMIPDLSRIGHRAGILAERPPGERSFLEGIEMSLNITAPRGSTVHLVFDPMLGDVINAVGSGRIQLQLIEGEFATFGSFDIESGDYLFTAGEVFSRRFLLEAGGTITWDGDPINARLQIPALYRTRASLVGLPGYDSQQRVPLIVRLDVSGRVQAPAVDLSLQVARDDRTAFGAVEGLEAVLNQPDRAAEFATSVLLTNTFLLTTTTGTETLPGAADDLFFNSVSQLVSNQLNRFVNQALTNVEFTLGVQSASSQDLDVTYGIALRLLDERLIIRGTGVYESTTNRGNAESLQGEFIVEVRLGPRVSVEVFYRREEDLSNFTSNMYGAYGAGVNYQADFVNWRQFYSQITRWFSSWLF